MEMFEKGIVFEMKIIYVQFRYLICCYELGYVDYK